MRKINKNHQSAAAKTLHQWKKKNPTKTYNDLADSKQGKILKREVRAALIAEQYCLCAYCTLQITLDNSHNEHVLPKGGTYAQPNKQLDYANLVAACVKGGCQCAKKKDAQRIELTPFMAACETELEFRWNGNVKGKKTRAEETIAVLGLNERYLVQRRKAVVKALLLQHGVDRIDLEDDDILEILREELIKPDNGCLSAFSPVLINILDNLP